MIKCLHSAMDFKTAPNFFGDGKDRDTDRSKEKDTGLGQKERFSHILLIRNIHRGLE